MPHSTRTFYINSWQRNGLPLVAQIANLLFRRLAVGRAGDFAEYAERRHTLQINNLRNSRVPRYAMVKERFVRPFELTNP